MTLTARCARAPGGRYHRHAGPVVLACELLAWMAMLALTGPARRWEPKRLRLRLFTIAGRLVQSARRLRLAATWPWARQTAAAITRLQALTPS
jgi:Transposase DDE domain group 1